MVWRSFRYANFYFICKILLLFHNNVVCLVHRWGKYIENRIIIAFLYNKCPSVSLSTLMHRYKKNIQRCGNEIILELGCNYTSWLRTNNGISKNFDFALVMLHYAVVIVNGVSSLNNQNSLIYKFPYTHSQSFDDNFLYFIIKFNAKLCWK